MAGGGAAAVAAALAALAAQRRYPPAHPVVLDGGVLIALACAVAGTLIGIALCALAGFAARRTFDALACLVLAVVIAVGIHPGPSRQAVTPQDAQAAQQRLVRGPDGGL